MTRHRRTSVPLQIALAALAVVVASMTGANARDCSTDERGIANARLEQIEEDQNLFDGLVDWHLPFGVPESTIDASDGERVMVQGGFVLLHDDDLLTALWAAERLTAKDILDGQGQPRVNCERNDPRLGSDLGAILADYDEPLYDLGHVIPDADLKDDVVEQVNSYVLSNMSPQKCRFNRGIWLSLEDQTRRWALAYDTVFVLSGAVFDRNGDRVRDADSAAVRMLSRNGNQRVAVPSDYYRIVLRWDAANGFNSISFLLPNTNDVHGTRWVDVRPDAVAAITTIEDVEDRADTALFPLLERDAISQSLAGDGWDLSRGSSNLEGGCD